jgi:hypothetical protein
VRINVFDQPKGRARRKLRLRVRIPLEARSRDFLFVFISCDGRDLATQRLQLSRCLPSVQKTHGLSFFLSFSLNVVLLRLVIPPFHSLFRPSFHFFFFAYFPYYLILLCFPLSFVLKIFVQPSFSSSFRSSFLTFVIYIVLF